MLYSGSEETLLVPQLLTCLPVIPSHGWMRALLCALCADQACHVSHMNDWVLCSCQALDTGQRLSTSSEPLRECFISLTGVAFALPWCSATHSVSTAVPEWGVGGEPRAVPQGSAECRQHFCQPHEEQPHAGPQHHQRLGCAVTLPVHQQHAPSAARAAQPAGRAQV